MSQIHFDLASISNTRAMVALECSPELLALEALLLSIVESFSVNKIFFKYNVHQDTTNTSYIQYNTFEWDTEISLSLV